MIKMTNTTFSKFITEKLGKFEIRIRYDGYIYASDLCKAGGSILTHYLKNKNTKEFVNALSLELGIPSSKLNAFTNSLVFLFFK